MLVIRHCIMRSSAAWQNNVSSASVCLLEISALLMCTVEAHGWTPRTAVLCDSPQFLYVEAAILPWSGRPPPSQQSVSILLPIYNNLLIHRVVCGCETWSVTLKKKKKRTEVEGFREYVSEEDIWAKRDEVTADRRKLHSDDFHYLCSFLNAVRMIKSRRMKWAEHVARIWGWGDERCIQGSGGETWRKDTTWKISLRWGIILKLTLKISFFRAWVGLIWLRIWTCGGMLWTRLWTFGSHKIRLIPCLAEKILAFQEGLCFMELVASY
jgi:hypothetical protein